MNAKYVAGVAGCGTIANDRHIPVLQSLPQVDVRAVYDHRWENAEQTAETHNIPSVHDGIDSFVAEGMDFVTVCTPPFVHERVTVPALEAGVSVLTEKPMTVDIEAADAMISAAAEENEQLGVVHNFLYSSSVQKAKRLIDRGDAGTIKYVKGFQLSSSERELPSWYTELPGGLFFDESPHLLYLIEEFIGDLSVRGAELDRVDTPRQLDSVTATYRGNSGVTGQLTMVFNSPVSEWFLYVVGSEKIMIIDIFRDILVTLDSDGSHSPLDVTRTAVSAMGQFSMGMASSAIGTLRGDLFFGLDTLVNSYLHSLGSQDSPPVTGEDGRRIVERIYDTIEAGRPE